MSADQKARSILKDNWRNGFSIPTAKLYPFQWLWDSGFVAMGNSIIDLDQAILEIDSMFSGQWENGFLPHILFHSESETTYFPNWDFWNSKVNPGAPNKPKSSGITQPPVFGFILEQLWMMHYGNPKLKEFIKKIFPAIVSYHRFLYTHRDVNGDGLFYIFHPWESGRDNSPLWDESLSRIEIKEGDLPAYTRRDTQLADASERPTADKYDRYVYLLELGKRHQYTGPGIAEESPFLIQDVMMNAILIKSNAALINLGQSFGLDISELNEWQALSTSNFSNRFWNDELKTFVCYDLRGDKQIKHKEIGGLVSLFSCSASEAQAADLSAYLWEVHKRDYYLCPSFDIDSELFDSKRYWRGPVWPQMNWMIHEGLNYYGQHELANQVKADLMELISKLGFYEYFESEKRAVEKMSKGYGGNNFSWTASTFMMFDNTI